jgi:Holliday junction resolvasome RuvABC ATP-dependent DNA helicase subunit
MNKEQLAAQAVACWIAAPENRNLNLLREALPSIDIEWMFKTLSEQEDFDPSKISLAIAGFPYSLVDLEALRDSSGLGQLQDLTDDLHVAAEWRNNRAEYPVIVSLAKGWHPGVSTLNHFGTAASSDLTVRLLDWAESKSGLPINDLQRELLRILAGNEVSKLISLDSVCTFLAAWFSRKAVAPLDAPREALPHLGVFSDPALFARQGDIETRLLGNFKIASQVKDAPATSLRAIEKRLNQRFKRDLETRDRLLKVCEGLARVRMYPSSEEMKGLTLAEVQEVFRPPSDVDPTENSGTDIEPTEVSEEVSTSKGTKRALISATGDDLLEDDQESLTKRIKVLEEALKDAIDKDDKLLEADVEIHNEEVRIAIPLDPGLLDWLHTFCNSEVFGGLLNTRETSVTNALKQHETCNPLKVEPRRIAILDGNEMNLRQVFADWDVQLARRGLETSILADWDSFISDRSLVVEHLDALFHFPLDWIAGRPEMADVVERYMVTSMRLYRQVQSNFRNMSEVDQGWAEIGLHGLLALDVMQVRCVLEDDRESWKAVLLPTHPLHLWRYQRLASVLRGLGDSLEAEDRKAVIDECHRPEQFMSVLFASSLPQNKGGARLLPVSSDLHGLATFENLQNACSGMDGVNASHYALLRFTAANRIHLNPLRVGVVNPPDASKLTLELSKILNERRESTLPAMRIELFSTTAPAVRGRAAQAMAFSSDTMDLIESHLVSGRLELQIHEQPKSLKDWISYWQREPLHVLFIFDEAGVSIRRSDMGLPMPMSPFCVRKKIHYQELRGTLRLEPTTDEPPFSEFMQLMNEADKGQRDSTPNAWADAENLRQVVDQILQGDKPGAHWLALADRALPAESGMKSVRLLSRREDQREFLLLSRDYRRLSELVRPVFNRWDLHVSTTQLSKLLEEGVQLTGAGILNLLKVDGTVDAKQILGLAGTLLAARDYSTRHPGALVVSVDHQIARYWLRLGKRNERCDLIALRKENNVIVIEALEVKSTQGDQAEITGPTIEQAKVQLTATLEAIQDGLNGTGTTCGPLSVPRCEMLKELFVRGCHGKRVTSQLRGDWSNWLKSIFQNEDDSIQVDVRGEIIRVALHETNEFPVHETHVGNRSIRIRTLGNADVQKLLEEEPIHSVIVEEVISMDKEAERDLKTIRVSTNTAEIQHPQFADSSLTPPAPEEIPLNRVKANPPPAQSFVAPVWPPVPNSLGMIGQDETVHQLTNRLNYAHDFNERFKDTMFVGSAGVGKSSFARAIADKLLGQNPIMFSGADLRNGRMIIEKLEAEGKVPNTHEKPVYLSSCIIFIDEVHALPTNVANILLSALDDARLTTIDNVDYNFRDVVFLMATTDAGKLTEAFRSRPDRVQLRNYTLNELAGILWLHGKKELEGFSLPQDVCTEIAARTKALPRVAVRMLTNQLIPHFYAVVRGSGGAQSRHLIGQAMTTESVGEFFERQGIDINGLDTNARNFLTYLDRNGATAEERVRQGLGISNKGDFVELDEYLQRLGLITVRGGRTLTREGRRYLQSPQDLRHRISRQS